MDLKLNINPAPLAPFELGMIRNTGRLSAGDFTQELFRGRIRFSFSPDLELTSFVQYDNESSEIGTNSRLRLTFDPLGDLFVIYNHNVEDLMDRWALTSNQLLVKVQYALRF